MASRRCGDRVCHETGGAHPVPVSGEREWVETVTQQQQNNPPPPDWNAEVRWTLGEDRSFACPVCRTTAKQAFHLSLEVWPGRYWDLFRCRSCASLSFPDGCAGDYEAEWVSPSFQAFRERRYIEVGAALDVILQPLYRVAHTAVGRYLEVGAGYGFSVDFARAQLGWDAYGIDPAPEAKRGAEALGWRLLPAYLGPDLELPGGCFDLVLASEVIEHLADPHRFLEDIKPAVASNGVLIITTPDAGAVTPDAAHPDLTGLLAPGWHLVLFNQDSLTDLLAEHGFEHREVHRDGQSLIAVASMTKQDQPPAGGLDRHAYQAYLDRRRVDLKDHASLSVSLNYRLYKDLVNQGRFDEAGTILVDLNDAFRRHFSIDFDIPDSVEPAYPSPTDNAALSRLSPMNLPGAAYFRGIHAFLGERDNAAALAYYRLAVRGFVQLHRLFDSAALPDAEAGQLLERLGHNIAMVCSPGDASEVFNALTAVEQCHRNLEAAQRQALEVLLNRGMLDAADLLLSRFHSGLGTGLYADLKRYHRKVETFVAAVNGGDMKAASGAVDQLRADAATLDLAKGFAGVLLQYHTAILASLEGRPNPALFRQSAAAAAELAGRLRDRGVAADWAEDYYVAAVFQELKAGGQDAEQHVTGTLANRIQEAKARMGEQVATKLQQKMKVSKM
ncbi:SAM-dependent methyltransferase [Limibacillus sp. MBR-115]